jgi:putative FmdB family regulatory protein
VPTYQYACTECGDQSEVVQRFSDDPLTICGACGGRLRKVFSPVGIVFKGSGFYRTDSRAGAVSGGASNGKSGESSDGSKSESGAKAESGSKSGSDKSSSNGSSDSSGKSESKSDSGTAKPKKDSKVA